MPVHLSKSLRAWSSLWIRASTGKDDFLSLPMHRINEPTLIHETEVVSDRLQSRGPV